MVFALDDAAVKVAIALNGAGVGVVVGTVRRVPGVGRTPGAGVGVTVGGDIGAMLTVGVG